MMRYCLNFEYIEIYATKSVEDVLSVGKRVACRADSRKSIEDNKGRYSKLSVMSKRPALCVAVLAAVVRSRHR